MIEVVLADKSLSNHFRSKDRLSDVPDTGRLLDKFLSRTDRLTGSMFVDPFSVRTPLAFRMFTDLGPGALRGSVLIFNVDFL